MTEKKRIGSGKRRDRIFVAAVLIPTLLYFTVFYYYPTIMNVVYTFCDYNFIKDPVFVGMKNINRMFSDKLVRGAMLNTFKITLICTPCVIIFSLLIARCLFNLKHGAAFFRSAIFATYLTSMAVVALVFKNMFGNETGFINGLLLQMGLPKQEFMTNPRLAMGVIILASIWKYTGYFTVIFLAGFSNVRQDLYDAAKIDGCNNRQLLFHITIPQLMPTIVFSTIISAISYLRSYALVVALTNGGPFNSTQTLMMYIFNQGFTSRKVGYASAMSIALLLIILVITVVQMKLTHAYSSDAEV